MQIVCYCFCDINVDMKKRKGSAMLSEPSLVLRPSSPSLLATHDPIIGEEVLGTRLIGTNRKAISEHENYFL